MDRITIIAADETVILNGRPVIVAGLQGLLPSRAISAVQIAEGRTEVEFTSGAPNAVDPALDFGPAIQAARDEIARLDAPPPLGEAQDRALAALIRTARELRATAAGSSDPVQLGGFVRKGGRVDRFRAGALTDADQAALAQEAADRAKGETAEELLAKQALKATFLDRAGVRVDGLQEAATQRIAAAADNDEAAAAIGWFVSEAAAAIAAVRTELET